MQIAHLVRQATLAKAARKYLLDRTDEPGAPSVATSNGSARFLAFISRRKSRQLAVSSFVPGA
ncbi:MAG: hypothetical protein ABWY12_15535, partial [Burkholderiales bacterium]